MKSQQKILLITLLALTLHGAAQGNFGLGVSTAIFPNLNPGVPLTPNLLYQNGLHEGMAGVNIYGGQLGFGSIFGGEAEYRYHFYRPSNNFGLYGNMQIQYVRFATGPARIVPFNYSQSIFPGLNYSMMRVRAFNNLVGLGLQFSFFKIFAIYLSGGFGYHFQRATITENVNSSYVNPDFLGSRSSIGFSVKTGISVLLIRRSKK